MSGNGLQTGPAPWMTLRCANTALQGHECLAQSDPLSWSLSTQVWMRVRQAFVNDDPAGFEPDCVE
jgi:hypothetical protein